MQASSCPASPIYCSARDLPQSNLLPIRHQLIFQMLHNLPAYSDLHVYHRILKDRSKNNVHHSVLPEVLHHQCHIRYHTFPHLPYKRWHYLYWHHISLPSNYRNNLPVRYKVPSIRHLYRQHILLNSGYHISDPWSVTASMHHCTWQQMQRYHRHAKSAFCIYPSAFLCCLMCRYQKSYT